MKHSRSCMVCSDNCTQTSETRTCKHRNTQTQKHTQTRKRIQTHTSSTFNCTMQRTKSGSASLWRASRQSLCKTGSVRATSSSVESNSRPIWHPLCQGRAQHQAAAVLLRVQACSAGHVTRCSTCSPMSTHRASTTTSSFCGSCCIDRSSHRLCLLMVTDTSPSEPTPPLLLADLPVRRAAGVWLLLEEGAGG